MLIIGNMNTKSFKISYNDIKNYYKDLKHDNIINLIDECKNDQKVSELISNCTKHNIYLFKKNKKNWTIKELKQLHKECKSKKKIILKNYSDNVSMISKDEELLSSDLSQTLSDENKNVIVCLNEINDIIRNICSLNLKDFRKNIFQTSKYIAEYSN